MAQGLNDKSILLIDADLRKGRISKYLGLGSHQGLSELLQDKAETDNIFVNPGIKNLSILLSGKHTKNPSELLNSRKMQQLISMFGSRFDYIFIDTPPVMPLTDACILGPMVDGVIMVVQAGRTQRDLVQHAETRLNQARAKTIGYIMTSLEYHLPSYLHRYVHKYDSYYAHKPEMVTVK
jgi:capsular exopolysaccharide synthesis family protein